MDKNMAPREGELNERTGPEDPKDPVAQDEALPFFGTEAEEEEKPLSHGKFGTAKEIREMHEKAKNISRFLKIIGNDVRLLALCHLMQHKELTVGELMSKVPPTSQSSLSQHLGKMRELGLITFRRDSQTFYYRIRDPRVLTVLSALKKTFCDDEEKLQKTGAKAKPDDDKKDPAPD